MTTAAAAPLATDTIPPAKNAAAFWLRFCTTSHVGSGSAAGGGGGGVKSLITARGWSDAKRSSKRGPASRLQQQLDQISQLPRAQQKFVSQMLDTVLQAGR